jgi:hypothetical protein
MAQHLPNGNPVAAAWCLASLFLARRIVARGQREQGRRLATPAVTHVATCYGTQSAEVRSDLLDATEDITIIAIRDGDNGLLAASMATMLTVLLRQMSAAGSDMRKQFPVHIRLMAMYAYAHLSAELAQDESRHALIQTELGRFRDAVPVIELWLSIAKSVSIPESSQLIFRYHQVWLDFHERIETLPKAYEHEGLGLSEHADHPSELVQRLSRFRGWGVDDLLESLRDRYGDAGSATAQD